MSYSKPVASPYDFKNFDTIPGPPVKLESVLIVEETEGCVVAECSDGTLAHFNFWAVPAAAKPGTVRLMLTEFFAPGDLLAGSVRSQRIVRVASDDN